VSTHPPAGGGAGRGRGDRARWRVPQCGPPGATRLCGGDASCAESTSGAREGASLAPRRQAPRPPGPPGRGSALLKAPPPGRASGLRDPGRARRSRGRLRRARRRPRHPRRPRRPRHGLPSAAEGRGRRPGIVAVRPYSVGDTVGGTSNGIVGSTLNGFGRHDHPVAQAPVIHRWGARRVHSRQRFRRARPAAAPAAAATPAAAARGSTKREDKDSLTVAPRTAVRRLACRGEDKDSPTFLIFPHTTTPPRRLPRLRRPRRARRAVSAFSRPSIRRLNAQPEGRGWSRRPCSTMRPPAGRVR